LTSFSNGAAKHLDGGKSKAKTCAQLFPRYPTASTQIYGLNFFISDAAICRYGAFGDYSI
jgi:hypothetical protein